MKKRGLVKVKKKSYDSGKEREIRTLIEQFANAGFEVRREKLKRGHGYRVSSGSCVIVGQRKIFVDSQLEQDEQLAFLQSRLMFIAGEPPVSGEDLVS